MKKIVVLLIVVVMLLALSAPVFAHPAGGAPAAHEVDGPTFGGAVSAGARGEIEGFNLADHARGVAGHVRGNK